MVSKNGNLLLNVGPKADGSFADEDLSILRDIGNWLSANGEAVYHSKPWRYAAEGPTMETEGQFSDASAPEYTPQDFRFTAGNGCVYAACMRCPGNGSVTIRSLATSDDPDKPHFHGIIRNVEILGFDEQPAYTIDGSGLHITAKMMCSDFPVVYKIYVE